HRINVLARGNRVTVKRVAIATRWGWANGGPLDAHISVRDPEDEGAPLSADDNDALFIGVLRWHIANLLGPLGHPHLALTLRELTSVGSATMERNARARSRQVFDSARVAEVEDGTAPTSIAPLLGGFVTRAGPLGTTVPSGGEQEAL